MNIFHITVATLVGTMAVFGTIIATAQSNRIQSWNDLLKPYEAKTNAAVPIAPISPAPTTGPSTDNPALLDRCEYLARRKLPGVMQGARVASITREFIPSNWTTPGFEYWDILIRIDFNGEGVIGYRSICRVWKQGAELIH